MARSLINSALSVFGPVLEIVYPTFCAGCGTQGRVLCAACEESLVRIESDVSCPVCGRYVGRAVECGSCLMKPQPFERGCYGFLYEGPMREALHAFKFNGRKDAGRALVRLLGERLEPLARTIDTIVPLPVTEKRLKERGFNQSFIIGEEIGKIIGKDVSYRVLKKVRETRDQYTLSKDERRKNIRGAFAADKGNAGLKGKTVLLVDDLYTTGNTAREASRVLKRAGADAIFLFALARTP